MKKSTSYIFAFLLAAFAAQLQAQATLSVQGTIQKSFGAAVDDGAYSLTFKLYTTEAGGTPVWAETQDGVEIIGGVYSVVLGTVEPLTAAFDQTYYLGIVVDGGQELSPRARLTASPYALSLIGQDNKFPSIGAVVVKGDPEAVIEMKQGANTAKITYDGTNISIENLNLVFSAGIELPAGQTIHYNGIADWRLIDIDDFEVDNEGWVHRSNISTSATTGTLTRYEYHTGAVSNGFALAIADGESDASVMKKAINLTGIPHTMVKVKLVLYPTGTATPGDYVWAGFAPALNSPPADYEWAYELSWSSGSAVQGNQFNPFSHRNAFFAENLELTTSHIGNTLVLAIVGQFNANPNSESFTIDNVEIYVR